MNRVLAAVLWVALLSAMLFAWPALYWPYTVAMGAMAAVAIAWALFGDRVVMGRSLIPVAAVGLWGWGQLILAHTPVPFLTLRATLTWSSCAIAFLLGGNLLAGRRARSLFLNCAMWSLTVLALEALLQLYIAPERVFGLIDGPDSVTGTFIYRNQFAAAMEVGGAIALWKMWRGRPVIGALCFATMLAAVVATASRAGSVLMAGELAIYAGVTLFRSSGASRNRLAGLTLAAFAAVACAVAGTDLLWTRFQDKNMFAVRRELRESTLRMIHDSPLAGSGLGTWRSEYPKYATIDMALVANEAHNDWLQWASDGGIPFALLMLSIAGMAVLKARRDVWSIGLAALMLHSAVDYPMRSPAVALLWFTLAGAACMKTDEPEAQPEP